VDRSAGTFSLSVNGKAIAHLLEPFVPREDPAYVEIRDEAMKVISEASTQSVLAMVEKTGLMPDVLFAYDAEVYSRNRADSRGVSEITPGILLVTAVISTLNSRQEMIQTAEIYIKRYS